MRISTKGEATVALQMLEGQAQEGWAGEEMEKLGRKQGMDCDG